MDVCVCVYVGGRLTTRNRHLLPRIGKRYLPLLILRQQLVDRSLPPSPPPLPRRRGRRSSGRSMWTELAVLVVSLAAQRLFFRFLPHFFLFGTSF